MGKSTIKLLLLSSIFIFTSCSTTKEEVKESEDVIKINVTQELNTIDPSFSVDVNSNIVLNNVYEGLYRLDKSNQPIPAGARELPNISEDGLTYTIKLNKEAKWSNGKKIVADDYIYALRRSISSKDAAQNNYFYANLKNGNEILDKNKKVEELGIKKIDDETLQYDLIEPTPYFTAMLAMPVFFPLNEAYIESKGKDFALTSEDALYNGPFVLSDFKGPGTSSGWTYLKNEDYWDKEQVKSNQIKFDVVKETSTNVNLFESGQTNDISVLGEYAKNKLEDPEFVKEKTTQTIFIGYNHTKEFYQNEKIRQAISLLIDREQLTHNILGNGVEPATGLIFEDLAVNPVTSNDFTKDRESLLKTDVEKAKKLWLEGKEELGLEKESKIEINLITFENEDMAKTAEYLQGVINEDLVGAKLSINSYPVSVFMENASKQEFDLYLVSWGADYADPNAMLQLFKSTSGSNWGKYKQPKFDEFLLEAQKNSLNPEERWNNLIEAENVLMTEQGITPIYSSNPTYLRSSQLKNVIFHNVGPRFEYKTAELIK
ncbi:MULTISPECIES: peptide ABC transporter substrate-binding protein [Vagococcus]|uniref:Oligopeptide ABC transporter, periplasmic oligopeptide-binding protein OppA (TC 3.A.1.5.1) n=1 Tax=Vagococcus fluvialis bH819 TaxID=1255619 RepID=A0A1X6WR73_9ENTE|nr:MULTISPECIES: peptide ABC transporter substrate-binding protein [Vagococcus]SLM86777.1 Oligopeptide ABC transporter, periplasmic oligopeptide-binding protein OppA (TC 3.A.1.5.1) [Vagococcus fluvialis bH819]HCM88763.1 peptide ABC transporter substrate-binding protein [Vagococcus sp.]